MMPAISAAYQTLRGEQVPGAAPALNILQRVGGSIGTALMAVALARFTASEMPGGGGVVGRRGEGECRPRSPTSSRTRSGTPTGSRSG
jgi:hypothetical protein